MLSAKKICSYILPLIILGGCNKTINSLQENPNQAVSSPPDLILGTVLTALSGTSTNGDLAGSGSWDDVHKYNQYYLGAYAYYGDNQYGWSSGSFNSYLVMKNVVQMEKAAAAQGLPAANAYESIGKFIRAWYLYNLTSLMGDVPTSEALQEQNMSPAYDSQKDVFKYILNTLDSANAHLSVMAAAKDATLTGSVQDIYFGGDLAKWQKAVNVFRLRVLVSLSKKATDADLQIPAQFAKIIGNPATYPIFNSAAEDLAFTYIQNYNQYPLNSANFGSTATRYCMSKTYVQSLTALSDPRVYITCEPAWALVDSLSYDPLDFRAFVGQSTGSPMGVVEPQTNGKYVSLINRKRYYSTFTGDKDVLLGYAEMCFNIAEAINRNWAAGNAEDWYKKGIQASMAFYGLSSSKTSYSAYFLKKGDLNDIQEYPFTFSFDNYYNQEEVVYAGGATGLHQVLMQKYIAMFQNSGWEAYYNYRRTGVPAFEGGSGIGNNGNVPSRWAYPSSEQNQNKVHWQAALTNQGFSTDDINGQMWLLKN
ncbi:Starch-binding associating with outer membrane [Filimonas lacunae]|uniref:Starch-binding associating with outer membrane n=1 Tax=Filimonas lacunae TaxID=477680 RepID=A0A173MKG6_9BACT|nr:SusD/RagB family nutrient-binding outer membrane lipoprotein [Filimonas lacunae]BAV07959.1 hypothetical protein FLA_3991 [Filimonas lacunae]SIT07160.1 Starch-binding associating with outer membrane [Filimonas lacunae]